MKDNIKAKCDHATKLPVWKLEGLPEPLPDAMKGKWSISYSLRDVIMSIEGYKQEAKRTDS